MQVFDEPERGIAARIGADFPRWLVMWGVGSRCFWAYPCFRVPRGTIAKAADPADLVAEMRSVQHAAQRAAMAGGPMSQHLVPGGSLISQDGQIACLALPAPPGCEGSGHAR